MKVEEVKIKLQNECGMNAEDTNVYSEARQKHIQRMQAHEYLMKME